MKIIFLGSSNFAVCSLKAILAKGYAVCCVVTQPDKKKGRGLHLEGTALKLFALQRGFEVFQPDSINTASALEFLKKYNADLFVVVAYGKILSQKVLDIPKIFTVNLHASLLPKYRGAAPINWALINGEKETGVTVMKVAKKMDAGPIILQRRVSVENDATEVTLEENLASVGAEVLTEALALIENKSFNLNEQDEFKASLAPKLTKKDGLLNWQLGPQQLDNLVRGCFGWPGAYTYYKDKLMRIYRAEVGDPSGLRISATSGQIIQVSKESFAVAAGGGVLVVKELQVEGKRVMSAQEFIAGHKVLVGELLGKK